MLIVLKIVAGLIFAVIFCVVFLLSTPHYVMQAQRVRKATIGAAVCSCAIWRWRCLVMLPPHCCLASAIIPAIMLGRTAGVEVDVMRFQILCLALDD